MVAGWFASDSAGDPGQAAGMLAERFAVGSVLLYAGALGWQRKLVGGRRKKKIGQRAAARSNSARKLKSDKERGAGEQKASLEKGSVRLSFIVP